MAEGVLTNEEIVEALKKKSLLEVSELVKMIEEAFGVTAAPVAAMVPAGQASAAPVEEKTEFTVVLAEAGKEKIKVIKEVRALTNLGLKEAKDLVEGAPKEVLKDVSKEEAENAKQKLEAVGAKVEVK
jgi:large subunit ribosomal protein L7/L12